MIDFEVEQQSRDQILLVAHFMDMLDDLVD